MKKKIILIAAVALVVVLVIIRINTREVRMIPADKLDFANAFDFVFMLTDLRGEVRIARWQSTYLVNLNSSSGLFNPNLNELVFVHNIEEAKAGDFPNNVIVAWPFQALRTTEALEELHRAVDGPIPQREERFGGGPARREVHLEDFGLTYPITVIDLVDNWQNVSNLFNSLTLSEQARIRAGGTRRAHFYRNPVVTPIEISDDISEEHRVMLEKFNYALALRFWFSISVDGHRVLSEPEVRVRIDPNSPDFDPFYTDILFDFEWGTRHVPSNVIIAFPTAHSLVFINRLHEAVSKLSHHLIVDGEPLRDVIHLRDFGLSHPLSERDLMDNWEQVNALWNALHPSEQEIINNIDFIFEIQRAE